MSNVKRHQDVEIGRIYRLDDFQGVLEEIKKENASDKFLEKYTRWTELSAKKILVLDKVKTTTANSTINGIKFSVYPINSSYQTRTDATGDWCICSFNWLCYISKKQKPSIQCRCNVWIAGCKCGVFKIEQANK